MTNTVMLQRGAFFLAGSGILLESLAVGRVWSKKMNPGNVCVHELCREHMNLKLSACELLQVLLCWLSYFKPLPRRHGRSLQIEKLAGRMRFPQRGTAQRDTPRLRHSRGLRHPAEAASGFTGCSQFCAIPLEKHRRSRHSLTQEFLNQALSAKTAQAPFAARLS